MSAQNASTLSQSIIDSLVFLGLLEALHGGHIDFRGGLILVHAG